MNADDRLGLIRVKIERAFQHLDELERAIAVSSELSLNSYIFSTQHELETGKPFLDIAPLVTYKSDVPAIAGDVVHNLRSALDHLAWQLVIVGLESGETRTQGWDKIQFPIAYSFKSYESMKGRAVEGMTGPAIEAIDRLNPYKGRNDSLWLLRELDNIDKHASMLSVGRYSLVLREGGAVMLDTGNPYFAYLHTPKQKQTVDARDNETLIDPAITSGKALLPMLHNLAELVSNIVTSFRPLLQS